MIKEGALKFFEITSLKYNENRNEDFVLSNRSPYLYGETEKKRARKREGRKGESADAITSCLHVFVIGNAFFCSVRLHSRRRGITRSGCDACRAPSPFFVVIINRMDFNKDDSFPTHVHHRITSVQNPRGCVNHQHMCTTITTQAYAQLVCFLF